MDVSINVDKIYVVHVSSNKLREQHIKNELGRFNLPFEFMLKGDKSEISSEIIEEYFIGNEIGGLKPTQDNALINFENSTLQIVPPSEQVKGQYLYEASKNRCAGAYYINKNLANSITQYRIKYKCNKIIDWYHNELIDTIGLQNYWCHPPIVEQGSLNGKMQSIIDDKKYGPVREITWKISRFYKHKIRPLFGNKNK